MLTFVKDPVSRAFLDEVVEVIQSFGGKSRDEALRMIDQCWSHVEDIREVELLRETPYYWAMCILHHPTAGDNQPQWYLDRRFMPPPEWIRRKYYSHEV